ncbi:SafA/ExsA family spore coat assembly protein [Amphibacillus jilinensis]|uniref:SafA/ExsA family spore coat assembly protein n=1 Tax=Amphibacillus jilinensis TaxID=1216008 RepID=UPI00030C59D0|nr:SafA/ExsA family spore coat assembly protein [Amphibacillus jilinensis]
MKIHTVQKGDTLWNLSKKYNVDFQELKALNNQLANPDMIMPGMKIKVPSVTKHVTHQDAKEKVMEPFKSVPQKAQPVIKEDDQVPKKEVEKKMPKKQTPLPKLPPMSIQMPKLPNIYSNHYNIDVGIEDNDTIMQNQSIHHYHQPKKDEKPKEMKKEEVKKPMHTHDMKGWPMMPCCYVWVPCMPMQTHSHIHPSKDCQPAPDACYQYQDPSMLQMAQPYYMPTANYQQQGQWGDLGSGDPNVTEGMAMYDDYDSGDQNLQSPMHTQQPMYMQPNQMDPYMQQAMPLQDNQYGYMDPNAMYGMSPMMPYSYDPQWTGWGQYQQPFQPMREEDEE